ncbi:MAG: ArsR family transcriptional regulator [Spirochaetales bacterium]|nr:ArsR family transcriptional regulator [Spirochaetales bacterium]
MPLYTPGPSDHLYRLIRFEESAVLEMLESLLSLLDPVRNPDWKRIVRDELGQRFFDRLADLYPHFHGGADFIEFAIAGDEPQDIPAFLAAVEAMPARHFLFLVLGRMYPEESLPETISRATVERFLEERKTRNHHQHIGADFAWCDDLPGLQRRLSTFWREYYDGVFRDHIDDGAAERTEAIAEKRALLESEGGVAVLKEVTGMTELPSEMPVGFPYTDLIFVPVVRINRGHKMYFGYGKVVVLFDAHRTRRQITAQRERRERLTRVMRALADPGRLRMLQVIAGDDYKFNGQRVASWTNLSTSVVSRHLKQLREAGLIEEHSPDNRNVLYRVNTETIEELSNELLRYVKDLQL